MTASSPKEAAQAYIDCWAPGQITTVAHSIRGIPAQFCAIYDQVDFPDGRSEIARISLPKYKSEGVYEMVTVYENPRGALSSFSGAGSRTGRPTQELPDIASATPNN